MHRRLSPAHRNHQRIRADQVLRNHRHVFGKFGGVCGELLISPESAIRHTHGLPTHQRYDLHPWDAMYRYSNGRQGRAQVTRRRGFHDHASNAAGNGRTDQGIGPASFGALRPAASLSDIGVTPVWWTAEW